MTITAKHIAGRIQKHMCDTHGRWTTTQIYRTNRPTLSGINAYMVCPNSSPGPLTYQMKLYRSMGMKGIPSQIRKQCWEDLTSYMSDQTQEGHDIIL